MDDEDTKQLLRDILKTQREQLALSQRIADDQTKILDAYAADSDSYRQTVADWQSQNIVSNWATIIRVVTMVGIVLVLGYVVIYGLHTHA
jgi:hypothetical protein